MADEQLQEAPVDGIRAFDQDGREVVVPREQWRTEVLPGMLEQAHDQPEQLYMLVVNSLNDGFAEEVTGAAEHLYRTDPIPARGVCMWSAALMQTGRNDEAEAVLKAFLETHGEDGSVLTNLARVYDLRGDQAQSAATLEQALAIEPNLDNGLGWYIAQAQERGGEASVAEALARIASNPAAWRVLLWQARYKLQAGDLDGAKKLYNEAIARVKALGMSVVPGDLLMQMSGDLGGAGLLQVLVEMTAPHFVPEMHGLPVGNNLIKASFDLGDIESASLVVAALARLERPEWAQAIGFWQQEIARVQSTKQTQIGMLRIDGPVWLPAGSPGWKLFGAGPSSGISVTFLGGTVEAPSQQPDALTADTMGRLTRSIALFLAEQVELRTAVHGRAMLPWATGLQSGFVLGGAVWSDEQAVQAVAAPGGDAEASTYAVTVHLDATVEPWTAELAFLRVADGVRIGEMLREFPSDAPEDGLLALADEVVEMLNAVAPASGVIPQSARYAVPTDDSFAVYLYQLEQLLAVRCASMDVGGQTPGPGFLTGERELLEGELALCQEQPGNAALRLLLMETMSAMLRVRPEIVEDFRARVEQFLEESPLPV